MNETEPDWFPPMVSYAQNGEDVLLRRAFYDQDVGFYVDVGAGSPVEGSVTKHFYDRGWHGINIEPGPRNYRRLAAERARDVNLSCAIGLESGTATLLVFEQEELSTLDAEVAAAHRARGRDAHELAVETVTLDQVLGAHAVEPIDFLKIDVEGKEAEVLASVDLVKWQPRVLVVESTLPDTRVPSHEDWEPTVIDAGYELAHADALNRFYVKPEDVQLKERLAQPPSIFDQYIPFQWWRMFSSYRRAKLAKSGYRSTVPVTVGRLKKVLRLAPVLLVCVSGAVLLGRKLDPRSR